MNNKMGACINIPLVIITGLLLISCRGRDPGASEKPDKLVLGYQVIPNAAVVARDMKWVTQALGIPVEYVQFNSGTEVNLAIEGDSVDIGLGGTCSSAVGIAQDMKFKVAYIYDVIGDNEALIVRNDKGINSLEDLKGRSVAAPFGSTTHYHLIVALKTRGIEPESVTLLDMPNPDILTAWKRGDLDAAFVWDPTRQQMLDSGGSVLISSRQLAEEGYLTADLCLVHNAFATQYPELVTRYVAVQNRAVEFCRSHPNEAAAAIARQFSITPEEALAQMNNLVLLNGAEQAAPDYIGTPNAPGHIAEVLKDTADFMVQQKSIRSAPGLEKFKQAVEPSFVNRALE